MRRMVSLLLMLSLYRLVAGVPIIKPETIILGDRTMKNARKILRMVL